MKNLALSTLFLLSSLAIFAQKAPRPESYVDNFNGFQNTHTRKPDSAVYFLHNMAVYNSEGLEDLMHNQFAQAFNFSLEKKIFSDSAALIYFKEMGMTLDSARRKFKLDRANSFVVLNKISSDTNKLLKKNAYPIIQWVEAQKNENSPAKLLEIGTNYTQYLKENDNLYAERKGRYGLMIADLMAKVPELKSKANELLLLTYTNLRDHQNTDDPAKLSRANKYQRAWYRYLFAYANFVSAGQYPGKNQQIPYLKTAADYSPDMTDKTVKSAYFYDMVFLSGNEERSFEEDYLAVIDGEEKFERLLALSMINPSVKPQAKKIFKDPAKFQNYWLTEFNKKFEPAPLFSLTQLSGKEFKLADVKNQWTLIDFWGTWCVPCRQEHPDLEKLYQQTAQGKNPNLNIITIASRDNEQAVRDYMKEFNYTFPVVMSDNKVEADYNVQGWPSKYLVSPQGNYVVIPYNVDWVKYIQDYIN